MVPGSPKKSPLIAALRATGGMKVMPPKGKLEEAVIADFEKWVTDGALDPRKDSGKPDVARGRTAYYSTCGVCHGANGVSVADAIPNLAGQKAAYLEGQLKALKSGARKNAIMNAIAGQLNPQDISNVAAYFSTLPGAAVASAKSDFFPSLAKTNATLPENYKTTFTMYQTVNRADINQVRYLYANDVAIKAAREGKPLPDGSLLVLEQQGAAQLAIEDEADSNLRTALARVQDYLDRRKLESLDYAHEAKVKQVN